ncbi:MAG TPA: DUF429 domain-containing protein [Thermoanaerobaculia bacterium]|jgi:predicted nuclease with RNAse H fold|nr:DUF429 domain-containing protein [Thermoanaerobaculia bacterium]
MSDSFVVAGIDVGGEKKGFHVVALQGKKYLDKKESRDPEVIVAWCRERKARFVGVDAPCGWSTDGRARPADRELMGEKIWCYSTPREDIARNHPKQYFGWMLNGAALFAGLKQERNYPLFNGNLTPVPERACFETFPHAVSCALAGKIVSAKTKRTCRPALLEEYEVEFPEGLSIDFIDAALCALTADYFAKAQIETFGTADTGYIIVPKVPGSLLFAKRRGATI